MKRVLIILVLCVPIIVFGQWVKTTPPPPPGGMVSPILIVSGPNLIATQHTGILEPPNEYIYASRDHGDSWTVVENFLHFWALHRQEENLFGAYDYGIFRSTNNGIIWEGVKKSPDGIIAFATLGSSIYAVGQNKGADRIYRSSDNGETWPEINTFSAGSIYCMAVSDSSLLVGTITGKVLRSNDSGSSWSDVSSGLPHKGITCLVTTSQGVFAGSDSGIYVMKKGSQLWRKCNDVPVFTLYTINDNIFAGTRGVLLSSNNGESWTEVNTGFPTFGGKPVAEITCMAHDSIYLYISDWGQPFIWRRPLSEMITLGAVAEPRTTDVRAYPNPASSETTISFAVPAATYVLLTIYTLNGDEATQLCSEVLQPGVHQRTWNAVAFPSGVYSYCLKIGETTTRKNIVIRH